MNKTLPLRIRELTVEVYREVTRRFDVNLLKSKNFLRDSRFLREAPDEVILRDLPLFGKHLDRLLAIGQEESFCFSEKLDGLCTPLPQRLFEAFVEGVHARKPSAVMALRQVLHLLSKLEWDEFSDEVYADFIRRNALPAPEVDNLWQMTAARTVWSQILGTLNWRDIIPKHGPGVVSTSEKPWEKMGFKRIYSTVEGYYPASEYFFLNSSHLCDRLSDLFAMQEVETPITKLTAVPKDFRGPRLISAEPLETQWLQQGQARAMMEKIEHHPLSRGYVNFTSQDVNRRLALTSSISNEFVTLDLKDASDRVSVKLCSAIFDYESLRALTATRSTHTRLPSGEIVALSMFSPMGSAVCFPIESLVFYSLVLGAIHRSVFPGKCATFSSLHSLLGNVYVYGDDIVVRTQFAGLAIQVLEYAGLIVNKSKTCTGPRFRESCGLDAYSGQVVTPVRIKHYPSRRSPVTLASSCDYINRFNELGMETVASLIEDWVTEEFGCCFPRSCLDIPLTVRTKTNMEAAIWNHAHFKFRRNPKLQSYEYSIPSLAQSFHRSTLPHWCEAFRCILLNTHASEQGYTVPHRVRLTTRWASL